MKVKHLLSPEVLLNPWAVGRLTKIKSYMYSEIYDNSGLGKGRWDWHTHENINAHNNTKWQTVSGTTVKKSPNKYT